MNKEIEKAIETLQDIHDVAESRIKSGDSRGLIYIPKDKLEDIKAAISALEAQQANMWIPITSGKFPIESSQRVNVTLKNEMVLEVWYINKEFKFHESFGKSGLTKVYEDNPVIAWKPLPTPYKEEQP